MMEKPDDIIIRLDNVTVDIPLRGFRPGGGGSHDPRVRKASGGLVLRALDQVSLTVRRGERIGIVGSNGNGKTTLLKVIAGLMPIAGGTIEVRGTMRPLLTIGGGTYPALTGRKNAQLRHGLLDITTMPVEKFVADVEEFADLGAFFDMPFGTYSPGMQSRLQFALNTVEPADILLLDEWMGVADRAFQQKARERLETYVTKNEAFLFATHNEKLLERMTDRRIRLQQGYLAEDH